MDATRWIRPEDSSHIAALNGAFPFQGYVDLVECRGIKYHQFVQISEYAYNHCYAWRDLSQLSPTKGQALCKDSLNMYHINDWIIRPATITHDCACAELLANEPQSPDWFICHWWGEKDTQFLNSIVEHTDVRASKPLADMVFWICAYANRQHSSQRAGDVHDEGVFKALRLSHGVLLILGGSSDVGTKPAMAFTRTWCIFETYLAVFTLKKPVDVSVCNGNIYILTDGLTDQEQHIESRYLGRGFRNKTKRENGLPVHILGTALRCCIESTAASAETDRTWILQCISIGSMFGGTHHCQQSFTNRMNKQLRAHFAVAMWFQSIENDFDTDQLADVLIADEWRTRLALIFSCCSKLDDTHLRILSRALPKQLLSLELSFESCQLVGNLGLAFLAKALPEKLDTLALNFQMCLNIGNMGVETLGGCLSSHLKVLRLSFECDRRILSVHSLTDGIACLPNLLVLELNLAARAQHK